MTTVADLQAFLGANVSGFTSSMREAGSSVRQLQSDSSGVKGHLDDMGNAAESTSGKMGGLKGALGGVATMAAGFVAANVVIAGMNGIKEGITGAFEAAAEYEKIQAQTNAVLKSTGDASGMTADEVRKLANELSDMSGVEDESIQKGENMLLTFTNIGHDTFPRATGAILDMSASFKAAGKSMDISDVAIQVGKALNDPIKGVTALQRVGVTFTESQKEVIKSLVETGKTSEAQKLILDELNKEFGGSAKAAGDTYAGSIAKLKNIWNDWTRDLAAKALPILAETATWLAQNLPRALDAVERGFTTMVSVMSPVINLMQGGMRMGIEAVGKAFDFLATPIDDFIGNMKGIVSLDFGAGHILDGVNDIIFAFAQLAYELGVPPEIADALMVKLQELAGYMAEFASGVEDGAVIVFRELAAGAEALWPVVQQLAELGFKALSDAVGFLADKWNSLPPWAKTAIEVSLVATAVVAVVGPFVALGAAVLYVVGRWDELNAKFPQIKAAIQIAKDAVEGLEKQFEKFRNDVLPALQNVAVGIAAIVAGLALPFIAAGIAIVQTVRDHFDNIKNIVEPALAAVAAIIKTNLEIIRDIFSVIFALLRGDWSGAWDGLKQLLSDAWEGMKSIVRTQIDLVVAIIKNLPVLILALATDFVNVFVQIGEQMISGLASKLTGGWADVRNAIWSMKDSIVSGLGNARDWLWQVGVDLIQGFIDGIGSMFGAVQSKLGDLTDSLTSWKGPPEKDRRLLAPTGQMIIAGLLEGMQSQFPAVQQSLQSFTSTLASAAKAAVPAIAQGLAGYDNHASYNTSNGGFDLTGTRPNVAAGIMANFDVGMYSPVPLTAGQRSALGELAYKSYVNGKGPTANTNDVLPDYVKNNMGNTRNMNMSGSQPGGTGLVQTIEQHITVAGDVNINQADPSSAEAQLSGIGYGVLADLRARGLA